MKTTDSQIPNGAAVLISLMFLSPASWAALAPVTDNFESYNVADSGTFFASDWWVFGNVYTSLADYNNGTTLYQYGSFPAPNAGAAFSAVVTDQGGPTQGAQQLSTYNDYDNRPEHDVGNLVEANFYQEQFIEAGNVGQIWSFSFDAKLGNIAGSSTAAAFIKTVDPQSGFTLTNFLNVDMTTTSTEWQRYTLTLSIDAGLDGQLLQFGFLNLATNYEGSGIFYDNVDFRPVPLPGAVVLFASGLAGLLGFGRRKVARKSEGSDHLNWVNFVEFKP